MVSFAQGRWVNSLLAMGNLTLREKFVLATFHVNNDNLERTSWPIYVSLFTIIDYAILSHVTFLRSQKYEFYLR